MQVDPFQLRGVEPGSDFAAITAAHAARCQAQPQLRPLYDKALLELLGAAPAHANLIEETAAILETVPEATPITVETPAPAPPHKVATPPAPTIVKKKRTDRQRTRPVEVLLTEYNETLELNPDHAPTLAKRGQLYADDLHQA